MANLFRRNTTTSAPKKDEEFSDYATIISHEVLYIVDRYSSQLTLGYETLG